MEVLNEAALAGRALVGFLFLASAVLQGCSGSKVTTKSSDELPRYRIHTMVLMPFTSNTTAQVRDQGDPFMSTPQSVRGSDISVSVPSNVEPSPRQTVAVPAYAAEKVTHLFWSRLQRRPNLQVTKGAAMAKSSGEPGAMPTSASAASVAKQLNADASLIGQVLVYQERVGSRLGASPPASVGFEVKVVAADGQVLWIGNYYERQRPITEDLMGAIHRWGAFVTAEELAQYGVEELMKEFPFGTEAQP